MMEMGLYSAVAPLLLLLVSSVWQYPAVLEEAVKWGIIRVAANSQQPTVMKGAVIGFVFGLSEAILYSTNSWASGDWNAMLYRIALTVPMHTLTAMMTALGMKRGVGYIGLIVAMVMHVMFNGFVG
jgi:hypothetical protein